MILFIEEENKKEDSDENIGPVQTSDAPSIDKIWLDIGNGKEALVKISSSTPAKNALSNPNTGAIIANTKYANIKVGEFIYYADKWIRVDDIKDDKCIFKLNGKLQEIPFAECVKEIAIDLLVCRTSKAYLYRMLVNGRKTLIQLGEKLAKHNEMHMCRADWYFCGRKIHNETRIEGVNIKPMQKMLCLLQKYEMRTFKRFKEVDESQGWYMSKDKGDGICIIPSQSISVFGFGMYHCQEGPLSYLLSYQISLYDNIVKTDSILVTSVGSEQVMAIYFTANKEPIFVEAGVKLSILVQYLDFDEGSKLYKGIGGDDYDNIDGNEPGLFRVEPHLESGNGTNASTGQIAEIYYAKTV
eukprot:TRINITY_DN10848_c0_g2_i1.p1 TRINITY_DN10848_c0_g2~~TRINITY_DN10848_c0_g2_i1.p1  ORF type:complete len:356 (+),score=87.95 TRINITY_DN10848_c0_g2_i1:63-1130(+)